jgi:hypothetical protein
MSALKQRGQATHGAKNPAAFCDISPASSIRLHRPGDYRNLTMDQVLYTSCSQPDHSVKAS